MGQFDHRGAQITSVHRLRQVALETRGTPAGILHASLEEGDSWHLAPLADQNVAKPLKELAIGVLGRDLVAHDDMWDESHADGVGGAGHRDDCAPQLEHRPKVVTGVQVVVDNQNVNTLEVCEADATHGTIGYPGRRRGFRVEDANLAVGRDTLRVEWAVCEGAEEVHR